MELCYLNRDEVIACVRDIDLVGVVEETLRQHAAGATLLPDEAYLGWQTTDGAAARSLAMPGGVPAANGLALGLKVINASLGNISRGLPRAQGLIMLFDQEYAWPTVLMEAAYISATRTACVTAVGVRHLAVPVRRLAVIGCGTLARAHLSVLRPETPELERIVLYDLDSRRCRSLAEELRRFADSTIEIREVDSPAEVTRGAELVVTTTTTTEGYLGYDMLASGALVAHVSLDDVTPDVVDRAGLVVVDDWNLVSQDHRRLLGRLFRAGRLRGPDGEAHPDHEPAPSARAVDATLGQVVAGRHPGRGSADDVVLLNPFGMAILDVALANAVHRSAVTNGLGTRLPR